MPGIISRKQAGESPLNTVLWLVLMTVMRTAKELSSRIHDINCHVNLIPVNPIKERSYRRSTHQAVENFKIKLEKCGIKLLLEGKWAVI